MALKSDYAEEAKKKMTPDEAAKCHAIIHSASAVAGGTSAATSQIPYADSTIIVPTQMTMIIALGKVFGYKITEGIAKSLVSPLIIQELGKGAAKALVGIIPIAGNIVKAGVSVSFTEALGWFMANEFVEGKESGLSAEELFDKAGKAADKMKFYKKRKSYKK